MRVRAGNPQIERTRKAVLEAASELLLERGFAGVTIDAVSSRSRVARSTIYRHWADLPALVTDAFARLAGAPPAAGDSGDVRADLLEVFGRLASGIQVAPSLQVLPSLADGAQRDTRLREVLAAFIYAQREPARAVVRRGISRGQIPEDTDVEWLLDAVGGPLFYRRLISHQKPDEPGFVEHLVDAALSAARHQAG